ncbi:hypothetical protein SGLAM104S_04410 [Streptomyces glaucescens]
MQGPTLPWLARKLRLGGDAEAADLGIESAPLERLRGHLLSVAIPEGSRMHGVEVNELRLPAGAAVTLIVRDDKSFVPLPSTVLRRGDELLVVATDPVRTPRSDGCARWAGAASWPLAGHERERRLVRVSQAEPRMVPLFTGATRVDPRIMKAHHTRSLCLTQSWRDRMAAGRAPRS